MSCFRGRRNQSSDNRWYSAVVRTFALTFFIISPAAYRFVREKFNKTLPCSSTFCKWYAASNLQCPPGILAESIQALKGIVNQSNENGLKVFASLSFDEIYIRKHVQWLHEKKKWSGYATLGECLQNDKLPIANNILVFMLTVLGINVSIPVAYYPITSLNSSEKKDVLMKVIKELTIAGVNITNIVCDGLSVNLNVFQELGCSFSTENLKTYFTNPYNNSKIYVLLDACHMIKLVRNALGDLRSMVDPVLGPIKWFYFETLESFRTNHKFVTNRFNKKHIQYFRNKMNVRLAVQTFSNSVAASMKYLLQIGVKQFQNCKATINFTLKMNKMFDVMNTKRISSQQVFKSALNEENVAVVLSFLDEMIPYLKSLKFRKKLCIESRRKTGFLGFLININSIKQMYSDYVSSRLLPCLSLFYHSQDPLETFFGRIRSLNGCNDNPTIQQFQSAIRKLLFMNEVKASVFANCEDSLDILHVSSTKKDVCSTENVDESALSNIEDNIDNFEERMIEENDNAVLVANQMIREVEANQSFEAFDAKIINREDSSIAFLAGAIEKRIQNSGISCQFCMNIFNENEKIDGIFFENRSTQKPCRSTFLICKYAHFYFDEHKESKNFNYDAILASIKNSLDKEPLFEDTSFVHSDGYRHKKIYVETIIDEYVRLYGCYIARCITLEQQQKLLRSQNKRNVIFLGQ